MRDPSPPRTSAQLGVAAVSAAAAAAAPSPLQRLEQLRELIAENDRAAVVLFNRRLELVSELWREKAASGLAHVDPERERWLLQHLEEANEGPLSREGLGVLHGLLLSLTKQELER